MALTFCAACPSSPSFCSTSRSVMSMGADSRLKGRCLAWLYYLLFRNRGNGVTVFFAISGFLITRTSIRRFGSLAQIQSLR